MLNPIRVIAYYLPQFHPIPENDIWWGKGFTEWTTVAKAKPFFRGHEQPKIPADLGFYDLRLPCVREEQARLARDAGIEGFCYWHYYFGNGKQLLETPFTEVLSSGKPDFPFCLGWANHSWYAKDWSQSGSHKLLIEQGYGGTEDNRKHFELMKSAFADQRYIRVNGKPLFLIFDIERHAAISQFLKEWNAWMAESGIASQFYFVATIRDETQYLRALSLGFDAVTFDVKNRFYSKKRHPLLRKMLNRVQRHGTHRPTVIPYAKAIRSLSNEAFDSMESVIPFILPNWDHSPRSGIHSVVLQDSSPKLFKEHLEKVFCIARKKANKLVFLKSWNEWGEGNYMEPDIKWGTQYLEVLAKSLGEHSGGQAK
jgi:hypothetical protein